MPYLTVNYPVGRDSIVDVQPYGLFPNGYRHQIDDLPEDTVAGTEPPAPLDILPPARRTELVNDQLTRDADAYRATAQDHDDPQAAAQANARADEIASTIET